MVAKASLLGIDNSVEMATTGFCYPGASHRSYETWRMQKEQRHYSHETELSGCFQSRREHSDHRRASALSVIAPERFALQPIGGLRVLQVSCDSPLGGCRRAGAFPRICILSPAILATVSLCVCRTQTCHARPVCLLMK